MFSNIHHFSNQIWNSHFGEWCNFWRWITFATTVAAQNELVLLALDRYLAVRNINRYQQTLMLNISYPVKCFFANLALSALVMSGSLFYLEMDPETKRCTIAQGTNFFFRIIYNFLAGVIVYFAFPVVSTLLLLKWVRSKLR